MTAADHANTIRKDFLIRVDYEPLDALQAQAEEQSEIEAQYRLASEQWRKRAEAAEVERDRLRVDNEALVIERDATDERAHLLAGALRHIAEANPAADPLTAKWWENIRAIARAALAGEDT